ncbi:hypothetical protein RhiLY_02336 [Ceratobasidium sp. AG-Ba]|nr:hypothetical protein RhiLY_02336 [Ceratobasidium sp. AG-Ba]
MSNEILFNSHALSSLKRSQLIKLCKRYGIKATGKTPELVAKLEAYAQTLPPASTFICPSEADLLSSPSKYAYANDSDSDVEENIPVRSASGRGRPSEQWEGVSVSEGVFAADGTIRGEHGVLVPRTNGTAGSSQSTKNSEDFGSGSQVGSSSSKSSITSSLKSFASAFVRPSKAAPEPREPTPPPPAPRREATPPPVQAPGPHTVRLIGSPSPFPRRRSAADLLPGVPLPTPAFDKLTAELAQADAVFASAGVESSPSGPRISFGFGSAGYDDGDVSMATITRPVVETLIPGKTLDEKDGVPEETSPSTAPAPQDSESDEPPTKPFVFGSPRYSVSNTQFGDAAAAVLREMNARMGVVGSTQAVSLEQLENVLSNKTTGAASSVATEKKTDVRFTGQHEKEFAKMDSIANHYSVTASRANKRKSHHEPPTSDDPKPNKIFTIPSHIVAPPTLPERSTKRARMSTADGEEPSTSATQEHVIRDSPIVRANLERKRRSSAARASLAGRKSAGGPRKSAARQPPPPASSRFGFVGRIVSRVWGGGSKKEKDEEKQEKEKGKDKAKPAPTHAERKPNVNVAKKFPSVPTEEPAEVPKFPSVPKTKPVSSGIGLGRPSVVPKAGRVVSTSTAKIGVSKLSVEAARKSTGAGKGLSELGASKAQSRPGSLAGQAGPSATATASASTRTRSTLHAPTAASLARQGTAVSKPAAAPKPAPTKPTATTVTKPTTRPLPAPPTTVGRAATSGATVAGSPRMASPPVRASSVISAKSPTTTARKSAAPQPAGRKSSVRSPTAAGTGAKPRQSIFRAPLTVDAMTMRGAAPTIQPFRLSPQVNIPTTSAPAAPATSPKPRATAVSPKSVLKPTVTATAAAGAGTSAAGTRIQRRPRISRSKVIARLEEKRAAAASANKPAALSPVSKARSSAHIRRSLGAVAARKALDADMERRARVRKSEAARRKSKVTPAPKRRSEGAVLRTNRDKDVDMDD